MLVLLLEFFFDLDIDKLRVINADGAGFRLLSNDLINKIDGLLRQLDKLNSIIIIHVWVNHLDQVRESRW